MGAGGRFKRASVGRLGARYGLIRAGSNKMEGGAFMAWFPGLVAAVIWGLVEAVWGLVV